MKKLLLILLVLSASPIINHAQEKPNDYAIANTNKYEYRGWEIHKGDIIALSTDDSMIVKAIEKYKRDEDAYYIKGENKNKETVYYPIESSIDNGLFLPPKVLLPTSIVPLTKDLPQLIKNTLFTSDGSRFQVGDEIKIGTGTMPDADFKFIRISSTSVFRYHSDLGYQGLANQANSFTRNNSGLKYKITRIDRRGNKKHGYVYYLIIRQYGLMAYEVDIENALRSGEVISTNTSSPPKHSGITSKADELIKLKKLYDDGVLTEAEFQAEKSKILNKD